MIEVGIRPDAGHIELPNDALTTMTAILGRRGSGKTTTALVLAEEFILAGLPVVLLDPLGVHWGLRSSADAKEEGYAVTILGGAHGDVPLEETAGKLVADLVVEHPGAYILDLSGFESRAAERRFATDFAERLYRRKQKDDRSALGLIVDEADTFAPQQVRHGEERLLGAFEAIARRGRAYGLGMVVVSQRPAVLNKNVLSQVELMIAHQVTAPQDRDALKAWAQGYATKDQVEAFVDSLASLSVGEAWIWSPAWLGIFDRVQIRRRRTFDSSATPKAGETRIEPRRLALVDLAALRIAMAETIEKAEADDPKKLRQEIAQLRRQLKERPEVDCGHESIIRELQERLESQAGQVASMRLRVAEALSGFKSLTEQIEEVLEGQNEGNDQVLRSDSGVAGAHGRGGGGGEDLSRRPEHRPDGSDARAGRGQVRTVSRAAGPRGLEESEPGAGLTGPEQRILDAIAWLEALGIEEPEQPAVAFLAGYKYGGGAFNNPKGRLRAKGLVTYLPGERICLTGEGRGLARPPEAGPSNAELHDRVMARLPGPERRLLQPLLNAYPNVLTNEELAAAAGYAAQGGAYNNPRGKLRTLGLIEYVPGGVVAKPLLFPEGAA